MSRPRVLVRAAHGARGLPHAVLDAVYMHSCDDVALALLALDAPWPGSFWREHFSGATSGEHVPDGLHLFEAQSWVGHVGGVHADAVHRLFGGVFDTVHAHVAHTDDPYAVLGVSRWSSQREMRLAYRALLREHHPDRVANQCEATRELALARTLRVRAAWDALCDQGLC